VIGKPDLYSDHITFWLAGSVSPLVLETGLEYGSSSELKGEYFVVFLTEELLNTSTYMSIRLQPHGGFMQSNITCQLCPSHLGGSSLHTQHGRSGELNQYTLI
jgi:hypothetical protein